MRQCRHQRPFETTSQEYDNLQKSESHLLKNVSFVLFICLFDGV